jgi:CheY-like chemotaxis protein
MKVRALVLEDEENVRRLLTGMLRNRNYEVIAYRDPSLCPLHNESVCYYACTDILISDMRMPNVTGLDFIEKQLRQGCKIKNVALMSATWQPHEVERARQIGCRVFEKPFSVKELNAWLDECETSLDPHRVLSDLLLAST